MDSKSNQYKDYYYILGVSPEATTEEIRDAYGELYDRYGPHVSIHGHDPETMIKAFNDIGEAFETLTDPVKRKQYDQTNLPHLQKTHLRALWGKVSGSDTIQEAFKPEQLETRMEVEISLKEAIKGGVKSVRLDDQMPCGHCAGQKPVNRLNCPICKGSGFTHSPREEEFEVPAGISDRTEIRIPAKGKYDHRTQKRPDLVVELKLRPHQFFTILGRDVACTVPITILEAVLGGEIECPTPTGRVIMKIQPLTQSGRVYRLKGMGLSGADFLVTVEVTVPLQISADEVVLFRKLKDATTITNPRDAIFAQLKNQAP